MLKGKVTAKLSGKYMPGFAFGTDSLIAAGTAIYEALALSSAKRKASPFESSKKNPKPAAIDALNIGIITAKAIKKNPTFLSS